MRGKFYCDAAAIDKMEAALCAVQEAIDEHVADLPMTAEMSKMLGDIEARLRQMHRLSEDRHEHVRPTDDRVAQALGWPQRY